MGLREKRSLIKTPEITNQKIDQQIESIPWQHFLQNNTKNITSIEIKKSIKSWKTKLTLLHIQLNKQSGEYWNTEQYWQQ